MKTSITMETIVVTNPLAFSACQLAQSDDKKRPYISGVLIEPSGRVTGTNGHYLVTCDNVVEPFKGKAFILKTKPLSVRQSRKCNVEIKLYTTPDKETDVIIQCSDLDVIRNKLPNTLLQASIIDATFYDIDKVMPKFSEDDVGVKYIEFNSSYVATTAKRLDPSCSTSKLRMKSNRDPIEITFDSPDCDGIKMILMPMRIERDIEKDN